MRGIAICLFALAAMGVAHAAEPVKIRMAITWATGDVVFWAGK